MQDLRGRAFGRLVVLEQAEADSPDQRRRWLCRCSCGAEVIVPTYRLTSGKTRSDGCWATELAAERRRLLDQARDVTKPPNWWSWRGVVSRYRVPPTADDRIGMDPRWLDYDVFATEMGERPEGTRLERHDPDGPFSAANCFWKEST